ncbi:hypothetical protein [Halpernia sp.]|uniref:hypothetical protein n=1 Tax=Halpernia sp. TaxID=2782209 RepID=UPI003A8CAD49
MNSNYFAKINFFGTLILTVLALINKEITIFYMLYLFWWQAFIEILSALIKKIVLKESFVEISKVFFPTFFVMFAYVLFIIILFGFVFSFYDIKLFALNSQILYFKNDIFNLNLGLTTILAISHFFSNSNKNLDFGPLSAKMLILHISIILGFTLNFGIKFFLNEVDSSLLYLLSAVPFILLKTYFFWKKNSTLF